MATLLGLGDCKKKLKPRQQRSKLSGCVKNHRFAAPRPVLHPPTSAPSHPPLPLQAYRPEPQWAYPSISRQQYAALPPPHHAPLYPAPQNVQYGGVNGWQATFTEHLTRGAALCDQVAAKFDNIITLIDGELFSGDERDLVIYANPIPEIRGSGSTGAREVSRGANQAISTAITCTNYFSKVNLYVNSRLPPDLPPIRLYIPTYPLLCLAARFSEQVYTRPSGAERKIQVEADWRLGTKAMVITSVPIDHMNVVVFAIRGSQTFMDWAVNLHSAPASPDGFFDDAGNLCHSGFLSVARKMVKPVAARLRGLLEEDPSRASSSLLITGHSAGGAVASLLYAHMLSTSTQSELTILRSCFKRVHCVTFGTPPISLLPLHKPTDRCFRKYLFLSFINEGDPVPRADRAYVRSLLNLYSSPPPLLPPAAALPQPHNACQNASKNQAAPRTNAIWRVPPATLSNAGQLILLRSVPGKSKSGRTASGNKENVVACATNDQQLRGVIFGDPIMHMMKVYTQRIEQLATDAVLAQGSA